MVTSTSRFTHDAFISYSSRDKNKAQRLASYLRDCGLRVWFDDWAIPLGADIFHEVERGLQNSRILVFCLSNASLTSDWAQLERNTTLFRDPANKNRRFIPVLIDDCEELIPDTLRRYRHIDLRSFATEALEKLADACSCSPRDTTRSMWQIRIEGSIKDFDRERLDAIVEKLRELSGDVELSLRRVRDGSISMIFEGSLEGLRHIRALFESGLLSSELGVNVIDISTTIDEAADQENPRLDRLIRDAYTSLGRNNFSEAEYLLTQALVEAQRLGEVKPVGSICCNLGWVHEQRGNLNQALQFHLDALHSDRAYGYEKGIANHCYNLGRIYSILGNRHLARRYLDEAHRLYMKLQQFADAQDVKHWLIKLN